MKYIIGEMVDFVNNFGREGNYYRGEIVGFDSINDVEIYLVAVRDAFDSVKTLWLYEEDIVEVADQKKTGLPEEWCAEFRYSGSPHEKHMIEVFTNGLCYVFAEWLQKHLYNSKIVYLQEEHHYVVEFAGNIYDITGDVTEKYKDCTRRKAYFHGDWVMFR